MHLLILFVLFVFPILHNHLKAQQLLYTTCCNIKKLCMLHAQCARCFIW